MREKKLHALAKTRGKIASLGNNLAIKGKERKMKLVGELTGAYIYFILITYPVLIYVIVKGIRKERFNLKEELYNEKNREKE